MEASYRIDSNLERQSETLRSYRLRSIDIFAIPACRESLFVLRSSTARDGTRIRPGSGGMARTHRPAVGSCLFSLRDSRSNRRRARRTKTCRSELIYFHKGARPSFRPAIEGNSRRPGHA